MWSCNFFAVFHVHIQRYTWPVSLSRVLKTSVKNQRTVRIMCFHLFNFRNDLFMVSIKKGIISSVIKIANFCWTPLCARDCSKFLKFIYSVLVMTLWGRYSLILILYMKKLRSKSLSSSPIFTRLVVAMPDLEPRQYGFRIQFS